MTGGWTGAFGAACLAAILMVACAGGIGRVLSGVYLSWLPAATGALLSAYAFLLLGEALARDRLAGPERVASRLAGRFPLGRAALGVCARLVAFAVMAYVAVASALGTYAIARTGNGGPDWIAALAQAAVAAGAAIAAVVLLLGAGETLGVLPGLWKRRMRGEAAVAAAATACFALALWAAQDLLGGDASWTAGRLVLLAAAMAALLTGGVHPAVLMILFFPAVAGLAADRDTARVFLLGTEAAIVPVLAFLAVACRAAGVIDDLDTLGRWLFHRWRTGAGAAVFFRAALAGAVSPLRLERPAAPVEDDIRHLVAAGFWPRTAVGAVAAASAFGAVLPPSLLLSLYAMQSHAGAFVFAGLAGGLVVLGQLCLVALPGSLREGTPAVRPAAPDTAAALAAAVRAVAGPAIVLIAVLLQRFTLSEAGAMAAVAVVAIGLARRRLHWRQLWPLLGSTARLAVPLLFVLVAGGAYAWLMTAAGVPQYLTLKMAEPSVFAAALAGLAGAVLLLRWLEVGAVSTLMVLFPVWLPLMRITSGALAPDRFGVLLLLAVQIVAVLLPGDAHVAGVRRALGDAALPRRRIAGAAFPFAAIALAITIMLAAGSRAG